MNYPYLPVQACAGLFFHLIQGFCVLPLRVRKKAIFEGFGGNLKNLRG